MFRLLAIRVGEQFGILQDNLLVFDPEFNISIGDDGLLLKISIEENPNYIRDFFSPKISSITCLVGKNGVGKSTIVKFLCGLFNKSTGKSVNRTNDIVIFCEEEIIKVYVCEERMHDNLVINSTPYQYEIIRYRQYPKLVSQIRDVTTLFYSNNFDLDQADIETTNYYNISTSFLSENIGKINSHLRNKTIRNQNGHSRYRFTEFKRQVDFVKFISDTQGLEDIPFGIIDRLELNLFEVNDKHYNQLLKKVREIFKIGDHEEEARAIAGSIREYERFSGLFDTYRKHIQEKKREARTSELFNILLKENFGYLILQDLIDLPHSENIVEEAKKWFTFVVNFFLNDCLENGGFSAESSFDDFYVKKCISNVESFVSEQRNPNIHFISNEDEAEISERLNEVIILLNKFERLQRIGQTEKNTISFSIREESVVEFLELYFSSGYNFRFMYFSWSKLSSGEESLIAFFSRLYSVTKEVRSKSLLLLIDEGDLYFHPEWQRKYLFFLIQFLNHQVNSFERIQLVLTTHSPYLLSDIPRDSIILLNKENGNTKTIPQGDDLKETFAGNIQTLYSKAFLLNDATVSEFAWRKIKTDIIDQIGQRDINRELVLKLIDKIGEPVLKSILKDKINDRR